MSVVKDAAARGETDTTIGDTDNIFPRIVVVVVIVNPVIFHALKATPNHYLMEQIAICVKLFLLTVAIAAMRKRVLHK
jgi:hypothetical protein